MSVIQIYTDGSYYNNKGGFGVVFVLGKKRKEYASETHFVETTNNRMEIRAILYALKRVETGHKIDIYSDSEYCIKTINEWLPKWIFHGSIRSKKNTDLWWEVWQELKRHENEFSKIKFNWIRSHAGNPFNEMADRLANKGRGQWDYAVCRKKGPNGPRVC